MSQNSGQIRINVQLGQAVQQLNQLRTSLRNVDDQAQRTNQRLDTLNTSAVSQVRSLRQIRSGVNELVQAYRTQTTTINTLIQQNQRLNQTQQTVRSSMGSTSASVLSAVTAFATLTGAVKLFQNTIKVSIELDSLQKTFYAVQGTMSAAYTEMEYLRTTSQKLGLDFMALAQSYKGFSAAAKFAHFDLATTRDMFNSVAESATVLGLSGEKTKLVLMALEQMISKGTVSMEELRRQLGDSLPGAFELGAKAMNMGLAEFNKLVASGKLMSEDFLPKFAKTLRETFGPGLEQAMKTPRAEIQRLFNELTFAADNFARTGFLETVKSGVRELTEELQNLRADGTLAELGSSFGTLVKGIMQLTIWLVKNGAAVKNVVVALVTLKVAMMAITTLQKTMNALAIAGTATTIAFGNGTAVAAAKLVLFGNAAQAASIKVALLTGGLTLVLGALAAVALPAVIDGIASVGTETTLAEEAAKKFGTTVAEAEAELYRFMVTASGSDPFRAFNESLKESEKTIGKITSELGTMIQKYQQAQALALKQNKEQSYVGLWGTDFADMENAPELVAKATASGMDKATTAVQGLRMAMNELATDITNNMFTTQAEVLNRMALIKKTMDQMARDPQNAAGLKELKDLYDLLAVSATALGNELIKVVQTQQDLAAAQFDADWGLLLDIDKLEQVRQIWASFGRNFKDDTKQFESLNRQIEKLYAASDTGKQEKASAIKQQIENYELVAEAYLAGFEMEQEINKARLLEESNQLKARQTAIDVRRIQLATMNEIEAAAALVNIEIQQAALAVSVKANQEQMALIDAAMEQARANIEEIKKKIPAALVEASKIKTTGAGAGRRDQSILQGLQKDARDAQSALEQLQNTGAQLQAQWTGDTASSEITKAFNQMQNAVNKLDEVVIKANQDLNKMKAGTQKNAAMEEVARLVDLTEQQKQQIANNYQLNVQLIERKYLLEELSLRAKNLENMGDLTGSYAAQVEALNVKLQMNLTEEQRIAAEYEKKILLMRQNNDLIGLASEQMITWNNTTQKSIQDSFATIIPNSLDTTAAAFSTMFSDIISGAAGAGSAFETFQQTIANMGKQILNTIMNIIVQWMIMKAVMGIASAVGGLAAGGGSVAPTGTDYIGTNTMNWINSGSAMNLPTLARGGVIQGGGLTKFASGGVLTSPHVFAMANGGLGVAGEAGPEAFVPLGRTREGKLGIETTGGSGIGGGAGVVMVVNVFNNASDQVSTRQEQSIDDQGNPRLDLFIDQIENALAARVGSGKSALGKSIDRTRGTNPARAMYV